MNRHLTAARLVAPPAPRPTGAPSRRRSDRQETSRMHGFGISFGVSFHATFRQRLADVPA
ncbi:hypothetical protein BCD48_39300 [Pseudofrankia sp. BMG5.36]|nr:hypothetical protein BCD48_39300 [Pseudofrankia sp. BMG5.36]